ncbi:MAG: exodeoxyribonuclease III [Spirochaetia bacterium]|jgi:exodeoxyribonuclease-3|nr:exodeoxyribonuclease III [Spirochaetia bacterium]
MRGVISWNVNGIRSAQRKGFLAWLEGCGADIVCVQETKIQPEQLTPELSGPRGYASFWHSAVKKGYSGVGAYCREKPLSVSGLGIPRFDDEGRVQVLEYPAFTVVNAYFPNSREAGARLGYKLDFCDSLLAFAKGLVKKGKNLVICGDYNIAHTEIDLARPKQNEQSAGYLPEEREWMGKFLSAGFVDTFRMFTPGPGHYSWWSYRANARANDVGWRIDYHCVNGAFAPKVTGAEILKNVLGSDHCPVLVRLDV